MVKVEFNLFYYVGYHYRSAHHCLDRWLRIQYRGWPHSYTFGHCDHFIYCADDQR